MLCNDNDQRNEADLGVFFFFLRFDKEPNALGSVAQGGVIKVPWAHLRFLLPLSLSRSQRGYLVGYSSAACVSIPCGTTRGGLRLWPTEGSVWGVCSPLHTVELFLGICTRWW